MLRSELVDARVALPVENLATNPSFERAGAGSTVVRRNLASNPVPAPAPTGWNSYSGPGGTSVVSTETDGIPAGFPVASYRRITWTGSPSGVTGGLYYGSSVAPLPVTPGRLMTMSIFARSSRSQYLYCVIEWKDAGGTRIGTATGAAFAAPASKVIRPWVQGTVPAGAVFATLTVYVSAVAGSTIPQPGDTVDATAVLAEERPGLLPFFYGATVSDLGIAYSWEGTAGASASVARAAVVEVARNFIPVPLLSLSTSGWGTGSAVTGVGATGGGYQFTLNAAVTADTSLLLRPNAEVAAVEGDAWTGSFSVTVPARAPGPVALKLRLYSLGDSPRFWGDGPVVTVSPGETKTVPSAAGATAPAGSTNVRLTLSAGGALASGLQFVVNDGPTLTKSPAVAAAFHGSLTPDADLTPAWTGAVNASQSVLYGTLPSSITYGSASAAVLSWQWASRGVASLRVIGRTSNSDTFASLAGDTGGIRLGMIPGRTYTALARSRMDAPHTGFVQVTARLLRAFWRSGTGGYVYANSPPAPNAAGETTHRVVFTIPTDATEAFVRLYLGATAGNSIWWDSVAVVEGVYDGPYLDGDMPGCVWRGTPHASTSIGYPDLAAA